MTTENTPRVKPPRVKTPQVTEPVTVVKIHLYVETAVPEKHRLATERALLGQMSRANALKIKCLQCSNYQMLEVRHCTVVTCALHNLRPYQGGTAEAADDESTVDADNGVE